MKRGFPKKLEMRVALHCEFGVDFVLVENCTNMVEMFVKGEIKLEEGKKKEKGRKGNLLQFDFVLFRLCELMLLT